MSGILLFFMSVLTVVCFSGCQADRVTPAPGAPEFSLEKYAAKHWRKIARPVPVFKKTMYGKTLEESEKLFAQFTASVRRYAPYFEEDCRQVDKAFNWPQGTYFKKSIWPFDKETMAKKTDHECTSWAVLSDLAAENQLLLHKNRDTSGKNAVLVLRPSSSSGRYGYLGLHDLGWLDVTMGMNTVGLAVTMNSGDKSDGASFCGMDTTTLGRIILENCKNADEAVAMLKDMVENRAYMHGKYGSIWLLADKDCVYVAEHDAKRFRAQKYDRGLVIRANCWNLPGMIPFSQQEAKYVMNSRQREFAVLKAIFDHGTQYNRQVTAEIVAKASRVASITELPRSAAPCAKWTVSAATFSIDREFPADLSTMYAAAGNPDYTFFIPVPVTINELPDTLLNQKFSAAVYKRRAVEKKIVSDEKRAKIENKINLNHRSAREKARKLLRKSFSKANRLEARRIMNEAFAENWRILSPYIEK